LASRCRQVTSLALVGMSSSAGDALKLS
jgi:hypothetical protein